MYSWLVNTLLLVSAGQDRKICKALKRLTVLARVVGVIQGARSEPQAHPHGGGLGCQFCIVFCLKIKRRFEGVVK